MQRTADMTGWPHAIVAYADFSVGDVRPQLDRLARYRLVRGVRMQLHWHENPQYRFAARRDLVADPTIRRNIGRLADYGLSFDLQVFAPQMADAADLAESCPKVVFVLQHAGMLEDLSTAGRAEWRAGMVRLAACAQRRRPSSRASARSCIATIRRISPSVVRETVGIFGAGRCLFGSNFPIEKLWTSYGALIDAYRDAAARAPAEGATSDPARHRDERLSHRRLTARAPKHRNGEGIMPLEIKILDYGDIELEFELPCPRPRLRPHAPRADARISHPRRRLSHSSSTPAIARTRSWRRSACAGCSSTRT